MDQTGDGSALRGDQVPFAVLHHDVAFLADWRLDDPLIARQMAHHGGDKLHGWLGSGGCETVGDLLALDRESILAWPGIGVGKLDVIAGFLNDLDSQTLALLAERAADGPPPAPTTPLVEALSLVADWGRFVGEADTWGKVERAATGDVPDDVVEALRVIRSTVLPDQPPEPSADDVLADWVAGLDDRQRDILRGRMVRSPAQTLDDIGQRHGVTRERIRQLESKLVAQVDGLMPTDRWRSVRWEVFALRHRFGAYAPLAEAELEFLATAEGFQRALVLWLAHYRRDVDRVALEDFALPKTDDLPLLEDGFRVDEAVAEERLLARGVLPELTGWALDAVRDVARVDSVLVLWPRNIVDKSCAVLAVRNKPMDADQLAEAIGGGINVRGLRNRLLDDSRVIRVNRNDVGLKSWGGEAYTSIVELMCQRLEESVAMPLQELAAALETTFDVNARSTVAYSGAPIFHVEDGVISLRTEADPFDPRSAPDRVHGLFRPDSDTLVWWIEADRDLMRGSGRAIPQEIATFLDVRPGRRVTLSSTVRDVPLNWLETSHMGPNIGSLKVLAEAEGVTEGDRVGVVFDRADHSITLVTTKETSSAAALAVRLSAMTGVPEPRCRSKSTFAYAIHALGDGHVVQTLRDRGDTDVAELVDALPAAIEEPA